MISLRKASSTDAKILLDWRNDSVTRSSSHNSSLVSRVEHEKWLAKALQNQYLRLFIAEKAGVPVGMLRAEFVDGSWLLSWSVSPEARGHGVGKEMVAILANAIQAPIRAEVKVGNIGSIKIAEHAGMELTNECVGVAYYSRGQQSEKQLNTSMINPELMKYFQ